MDSSEYHWLAWKDALASVGYAFTREDFHRTFGLRNDSILSMLLDDDIAAETMHQVESGKENAYRRYVREQGLDLLPGVRKWLERLEGEGWRQAVASSAPQANLDLVLDVTATRGYFDAVITGGDVAKGKPDPEAYFAAAARLGVPIERCVVVEDAPSAIEGARRAGIKTIAVKGGLADLPADAFERLVPA